MNNHTTNVVTDTIEEWRDVVGFEGIYVVSSLGRIMRVRHGSGTKPGTIKKPSPNRCGYLGTQLSKGGNNYGVRVHRVVAEAFHGPAPEGMEVNHKNGIKSDNRACNLEWVTKSQNQQHSIDVLGVQRVRGERHGRSKFTPDEIRSIRRRAALGESQRGLAREFGVSSVAICYIVNRKCWKHI